jgi:tRNA (cmo5U34)-methyltransferase
MDIPHDWTFKDKQVADGFDRHVREQLPWYDLTTGVIAHFARHYIPQNGKVYDVGASTGNIGKALADTLKSRNAELTAIEPSQEMADKYTGPGKLVVADARGFDWKPYDLAVCFLVLMFITPFERREIIRKLKANCNSGGAILLFDKCQPVGGYPSVVMQRLTLAGKVAAGVSSDEVIAKELSLAGAQRPLAKSEIPPEAIEIFRFGDFAGWLIEAPYPEAQKGIY